MRPPTGRRSRPRGPRLRVDPFDPGLPLRRPRRARPQRAATRHRCCSRSGARPPGPTAARGPNYAPDDMRRSRATSRTPSPTATRAAHPGYPYVGFYTIWNEPNLRQFLAPAVRRAGQVRSRPDLYAHALPGRATRASRRRTRLARSRIGETSSRGTGPAARAPAVESAGHASRELLAGCGRRLPVRRLGAPSVPDAAGPAADAAGAAGRT